ncbi:hypothetical protein SLS62_001228 [Diatrype stigma]|uniref:Uncharacterized protein n=1 Tax=Diatrype stigma TaxID=117547 RepID=A0AAN9YWW2_9PEZI
MRSYDDNEKRRAIMRRSPWVTRGYRLRGIGITLTRLGRHVFISGIRLLRQADPASEVWTSDEIGYTSFAFETVFPVSEHEDLRGIRVLSVEHSTGGAITSPIVGIKFVFSSMSTRTSRETDWIRTPVMDHEDVQYLSVQRSCPLLPFTLIGSFNVGVIPFMEKRNSL